MARKPQSFKREDVAGPPRDQPWIWHTAELLRSPAWRSRSINCVRLIEYLEIQHMQHAGTENGNLIATYGQLVGFGIGRRLIPEAVREAEQLGLIEVRRRGRMSFAKTNPTTYRLTYFHCRVTSGTSPYWTAPTEEWRRFKAAPKNNSIGHEGEP